MTEHNNIGEAWLAIMQDVGYVQKTGVNKAQNYKYAGERQLIEALRPALLKHGVICYPSKVVSRSESVVIKDGNTEKKTFRTVADYEFTYVHVSSNTKMVVASVGEGVDTGDKSAYKAATGALKYALRQPALIETGDEPEAHEPEEDRPKTNPHGGEKTPYQEYGGNKQMYARIEELKDAISRAGEPEHFSWLQSEITKLEHVFPHGADELQQLLDDRENHLLAVKC